MVRATAAARPAPPCTVSAKTVRAVLSAATAVGVDAEALARAHGFTLADLDGAEFRYPHAGWVDLWNDLERRTGNPAVALETSAIIPLHWDAADYLFGACANLGEAFGRFERHHALVSTAVRHVLRVSAVDAELARVPFPFATGSRAASEFALATIVRRFRVLAAHPWSPQRVRFRHAPSAPSEVYRQVFGCEVSFGCEDDALVLARETLEIPMDRAAPGLVSVLEQVAETTARHLPGWSDSVVARAQRAIATDLRGSAPSLGVVAKRLGMSARTLQRRLLEADAPYRALVERTRKDLACVYLDDARNSLGEVGFLLGFADASAFYKAFRRWTGRTPGQYRRRDE
jgi:AraC-like DNA-binding protein